MEEELSKKFKNSKTGDEQGMLRCKIGEDHEECTARLAEDGWEVDTSNSIMDVDDARKPILVRR